jgi:hypothetical protein
MADFDRAFAFEAVARASALAGRREEAQRYFNLAQQAGEAISDEQDRSYFLSELKAGQ